MQVVELVSKQGKSYQVEVPPASTGLSDCYFFSYHKSGSTLMDNMISEYCSALKAPCFSLFDAAFNKGIPTDEVCADAQVCFVEKSRVYQGFRHYPSFDLSLSEAQIFLLVRDPRDMLVSMYYSVLKSHVIPAENKNFLKNRQFAQQLSIDQFVIQKHEIYLQNFEKYQVKLPHDHLVTYCYEDVIYEKEAWLTDMIRTAGLKLHLPLVRKVATRFDVIPKQEDQSQHIRQVHPGNHRKKLKPATIRLLNEKLAGFLACYGYV